MKRSSIIIDKVYRKLYRIFFRELGIGKCKFLYRSYRHYCAGKSKKCEPDKTLYLTAKPNRGAGIGHQMDGWMAGYYWAVYFNIKYAYSPFPDAKWNQVLGLGENLVSAEELIKKYGYKKRNLPYFKMDNPVEVEEIKAIIKSHTGGKYVFCLALDQFCDSQYEISQDIKELYRKAQARETDNRFYSKNDFNIMIHIRRGDIINKNGKIPEEYKQRWLNNEYYINVLNKILPLIPRERQIKIYLFSQGKREDFSEFNKYREIKYCLDISEQDTFVALTNADILITGKSSFSYDAALLSGGIKICPENFWCSYPDWEEWILAGDNGELELWQLERVKNILGQGK